MGSIRLLGAALVKFDRDRGFFLASGIAFQALLCLVPIALLALSVAGSYFFADERVIDQVRRFLERAAPALDPTLSASIIAIVSRRHSSGVIGTVGLLWMATTLFGWLRVALNAIFEVPKARGTLHGLGFDLMMIVLCTATFVLSIDLTGLAEYLRRTSAPTGWLLGGALSYLLPFLPTLAICYLVYHLVPNRPVSARAALQGAVFTGILWEAAKHLFTWYASTFKGYSLVYGSLSAVAMLLVWTYYSAVVLLLGAEVVVLLERERGEAGA